MIRLPEETLEGHLARIVERIMRKVLSDFFRQMPNNPQPIIPPELQIIRERREERGVTEEALDSKYISLEEAEDLLAQFIKSNKANYDLGEKVAGLKKIPGAFAEFVREIEGYTQLYNLEQSVLKKGTLSKFGIVVEKYVEEWKIPVEQLYPVSIFDLYDFQNEKLITTAEEALNVLKRLKSGETTKAIKQSLS